MAAWLVVVLFSVGAVLLFVVGLSLTLIFKGHHIDGEISTNRHMRALGISCAVKDALDASGEVSGCAGAVCSDAGCGGRDCADHDCGGHPTLPRERTVRHDSSVR